MSNINTEVQLEALRKMEAEDPNAIRQHIHALQAERESLENAYETGDSDMTYARYALDPGACEELTQWLRIEAIQEVKRQSLNTHHSQQLATMEMRQGASQYEISNLCKVLAR